MREEFNDFINRIYGDCSSDDIFGVNREESKEDDKEEDFSFLDFIERLLIVAKDLDFDGDIINISRTHHNKETKKSKGNVSITVPVVSFINAKLINKTYYGSLVPDSNSKCECIYHHLEDTLYIASNSLEELEECIPTNLIEKLGVNNSMIGKNFVYSYEIPYELLVKCNCKDIYF